MKSNNFLGILLLLMIFLSISLSVNAEKKIKGWAYELECPDDGAVNVTYSYNPVYSWIVDDGNVILVRWDTQEERWYPIKSQTRDGITKQIEAHLERCENQTIALAEELEVCDGVDNDGDGLVDEGYCDVPEYTKFDGAPETTDLSTKGTPGGDFTPVSGLTLQDEVSSSKVKWNNPVDVVGENYDSNVNLGNGFVSLNAQNLDSTIDSSANVTITGINCANYVIYYSGDFYDTNNDIVSNGQVCNSGTNPSCNVIECVDGNLTFSVDHFDSYGTGSGSSTAVPEFSEIMMLVVGVSIMMGLFYIRKN